MRSSGTCHRNFRGNPRRPRTNGGCCGYQFFKLYTLNGRVLYQSKKKNRALTGRYTLGDRAISTTQNRCGLLNALGCLTFYRLENTEQKIFPRKGLPPVINLQVPPSPAGVSASFVAILSLSSVSGGPEIEIWLDTVVGQTYIATSSRATGTEKSFSQGMHAASQSQSRHPLSSFFYYA